MRPSTSPSACGATAAGSTSTPGISANRERPQPARQYVLRQEDESPQAPADGHAEAFATVIAETTTTIDKLTVSEAVMRLDLADQQVMMFHNSTTGELNVVYRRTDGHIGWIDPAAKAG